MEISIKSVGTGLGEVYRVDVEDVGSKHLHLIKSVILMVEEINSNIMEHM